MWPSELTYPKRGLKVVASRVATPYYYFPILDILYYFVFISRKSLIFSLLFSPLFLSFLFPFLFQKSSLKNLVWDAL